MAAERYISLDVRATSLKSAGSDVATSGYASAAARRVLQHSVDQAASCSRQAQVEVRLAVPNRARDRGALDGLPYVRSVDLRWPRLVVREQGAHEAFLGGDDRDQ
jgi:hypothetical protein